MPWRRAQPAGPIRFPTGNPFTPTSPITSAGLFAGRSEELAAGLAMLQQAIRGNAVHGLITGARGIGKTSLSFALERIASGNADYLKLVKRDERVLWRPLIVATVVTQREWSVDDLAAAMARQLERSSGKSRGISVTELEIDAKIARFKLGSGPANAATDPATRLAELLAESWDAVKDTWSGILLVVDEADRVAASPGVAGFFKSLTELMARSGLGHICLLLVGTQEVSTLLAADHASFPRLLRELHIPPLERGEVRELLDKALIGTGISITDSALGELARRSGGLPYLVQRIGFEAYELLPSGTQTIGVAFIRRAASRLVDSVSEMTLGDGPE